MIDSDTLHRAVEAVVATFPPAGPGRISRERRYVRAYLYRVVYGRKPHELQRQFGMTRGQLQHALIEGQRLCREASEGDGPLNWAAFRDLMHEAV